ncbi:hypothetical protein MRB53_038771 [Persea americana]|nr:hypothetical protein MRB53_038771 [Persea americana]
MDAAETPVRRSARVSCASRAASRAFVTRAPVACSAALPCKASVLRKTTGRGSAGSDGFCAASMHQTLHTDRSQALRLQCRGEVLQARKDAAQSNIVLLPTRTRISIVRNRSECSRST